MFNDKITSVIICPVAEWCNGSTADSDSVCEGSNPSSAAKFISRCSSAW